MYEIIMTTWYHETPTKTYEDVYGKLGFQYLEDACDFFAKNYKEMIEYFPVDKFEIRFNKDRTIETSREERINEILKK